jgi:hypothetical protein
MSFLNSRWLLVLVLVAVALAGVACVPAFAQNPVQMEQTIVQMTNAYRAQNGRAALGLNPALVRAAEKYAQRLAQLDITTGDLHVIGGGTPASRAQAEGYPSTFVGENIQYNSGNADPAAEAMRWWKNSPAHNANLLNTDYREIGVGAAQAASGRWWFVADFGRSDFQGLKLPGRPDPGLPSPAKARVQVTNNTTIPISFGIEGSPQTVLAPAQSQTFDYPAVTGTVHYSWSYKLTTPPGGGGAGAGILQKNTAYRFDMQNGSVRFVTVGTLGTPLNRTEE